MAKPNRRGEKVRIYDTGVGGDNNGYFRRLRIYTDRGLYMTRVRGSDACPTDLRVAAIAALKGASSSLMDAFPEYDMKPDHIFVLKY